MFFLSFVFAAAVPEIVQTPTGTRPQANLLQYEFVQEKIEKSLACCFFLLIFDFLFFVDNLT